MQDFILNKIQQEKNNLDSFELKRSNELELPAGVSEIQNIPYYKNGTRFHRLDIYHPTKNDNLLPVIVDVHGGGLLMGKKELNRYFCAELAAKGFLVFSLEYRLVPEVKVYHQFRDISAGMNAVERLLKKYKGDKEHIYMVGDSAGAYLITYTVAMQKSQTLAAAAHVTPSTLPVKAVGFMSGMFYTTRLDNIGIFLPKYFYGKHYRKGIFAPYTNPEHPEIIKNLPPCYLMSSQDDYLNHYTLRFAKALEKNGITYKLANYPKNEKLVHAFSTLYPELEESKEANQKMLEFLTQY